MSARRALLTGASGFIGSRLAQRLLDDGWEVHLVLRPDSAGDALPAAGPRLHLHRHDGSTTQLVEIMRAAAPQAVFHLASLFLAQHQVTDVERLVQANLLFGTQLAEAMAQCGVRLLVNTSTAWEHYEDGDYNPVCLYAATKHAFSALLRYYVECHGLRVATLKLFDTYGPGDTRPKALNLLKRIANEGSSLAMSPGEQLIDLVYIDDVLDAFLQAWQLLANGGQAAAMAEYGVSSGAPLALRALAELYSQASGKPLNIEWGGRPYRPREVMVPWTRYQTVPGWQPKVTLAEGLARFHHG
ncbi:NAD-dependent epimerase/dehydratase family protein [Pseudoduganella sp. DS3]|uniref:NAD-dependent epimerase/dehydratase family protein n=1 Tax=Pseudoduganella guangdongensis TaxID=2692179 RepID=A0A6N9HLS0_9BURK|nr:NAD(P)-dependent oxidoreductase [Pseudoduganella guangdongensis]MYN04299.1 NAD-dependent epimerase/dehydratase family protein [Pseudoduganella guangdongensis]